MKVSFDQGVLLKVINKHDNHISLEINQEETIFRTDIKTAKNLLDRIYKAMGNPETNFVQTFLGKSQVSFDGTFVEISANNVLKWRGFAQTFINRVRVAL